MRGESTWPEQAWRDPWVLADPAGDVQWIPDGDLSYMDLRSAWFQSVRADDGSLEAFRVTIRNAAIRPDGQPLLLMAAWRIAGTKTCAGQLEIMDTDKPDPTAGASLFWYQTSANVYSWCEGDSNVITLGPITVIVLMDGRKATLERSGVDYITTIPLALFDGSTADGLYHEDAVLSQISVNTFKVLPAFAAIGVDYNETARDFVLGS